MNSTCVSFTSVLIALSFLGACSDQRKPIMPRTGNIPLKVWIVVGVGESGSLGDPSNRGCPLTVGEVTAQVQHLQNNSYFYGANINFQWSPGTETVVEDNALLPFQPRTRRSIEWHQMVVGSHWQAQHINIYFVGNVQVNPSSPRAAMALTLDPRAAQSWTPERARFLINDGGYETASGFVFGFNPGEVTSYNVIEHEMTHYLARFDNLTFGPPANPRNYDCGEHVDDGENNILDRVGGPSSATPTFPLVVPGRWNKPNTEQKRIWDRVFAGLWNNP